MTRDEEILHIWRLDSDVTPRNYEWRDIYRSDLIDLIRRVREDEREKCADFAEDLVANGVVVLSAGEVSSAIRNRKEQP